MRQNIKGFAAGYNAYLRKTGRAKLPDPTCRGKAWVRPITTLDVYRRFYQLGLRASSGNFLREIVSAAPPTAGASATAAALPIPSSSCAPALADDPVLGSSHTMGSNAYSVGSDGTRDGRSVVLGNPHFPWQGSELVRDAPDRARQARRDRRDLQGIPVVNIGFNKHVAWSHTVSTARRFTPCELKLESGDPRSYVVDGKSVKMKRRTVSVRTPSGTQRHTFYETRWGPVFGFPRRRASCGTRRTPCALADVNADNFRLTNQWFEYDKAKSVGDLRRASARCRATRGST